MVYEITFMEEYTKVNDFSSTITLSSGLIAKIGDLGLMDNKEDTYMGKGKKELQKTSKSGFSDV
jgi:hypothetical protein